MNHTDTQPAPLFAVHLQPLRDRLDDSSAVTYARPVELSLTDTDEPRIAQYMELHGVRVICSPSMPSAMLAWPDGALGPVWLEPGKPVTDCLVEAYAMARDVIETIHFRHAPAVAGTH